MEVDERFEMCSAATLTGGFEHLEQLSHDAVHAADRPPVSIGRAGTAIVCKDNGQLERCTKVDIFHSAVQTVAVINSQLGSTMQPHSRIEFRMAWAASMKRHSIPQIIVRHLQRGN